MEATSSPLDVPCWLEGIQVGDSYNIHCAGLTALSFEMFVEQKRPWVSYMFENFLGLFHCIISKANFLICLKKKWHC